MEIKTKIEGWLVPFLEERHLFLVELKVQGKKKIEVFADSDTGISINECAEISKFLGGLLDEADIMSDNYTLDVSSPGMSNPLRVPRQYKRRIGRTLEILKTDGKEVVGVLEEVHDDHIVLLPVVKETKGKKKKTDAPEEAPLAFSLKYDEIKRALIQINWK